MSQTGSGSQPSTSQRPRREELFRLLVESVSDYAIFVLDTEGNVMTWNKGAQRIKGYRADEILGRHFSAFYLPEDIQAGVPVEALRVARDGGHWESEGWRVRKDGTRFWASVVITSLWDDEGQLVGFAKVTRDLTARKRSEHERENLLEQEKKARQLATESVNRLQSIQAITEAALAHLDVDGLLADLLDKISRILSVDTVAVLLLEDEDSPDGQRYLRARAAKGIEEEVEQGVRIPLGKGFAGTIAASKKPLVLDRVGPPHVVNPILWQKEIDSMLGVPLIIEGRVVGVLHVGSLTPRKFTEQDVQFLQIVADRVAMAIEHARLIDMAKTAHEEARTAEREIEERDAFLSVAAHELKTPATTLRLAAQLLEREVSALGVNQIRFQSALRAIDRQSAQLGRLVGRLLDRVRMQQGLLDLDVVDTDIGTLLREVVGRIAPMTDRHAIDLEIERSYVLALDPVRIEQVLTNLLDNAIKYSPDGGPINVRLLDAGDATLHISVSDQGLGVAPDRRERLFERFYQAHGDDNRSGLGLGLFISREIVELHGGRIWAEFPDSGGTSVILELPVAQATYTESVTPGAPE